MLRTNFKRLSNIPWHGLLGWLFGNRLRILMYHSISENLRNPQTISTAEFKRQMASFQATHVISLAEGLELLKENQSLKNTWVITFDDGLLDFYTTALPVLREFNYPVTVFIPTGLVGTNSKWDSYNKTKPLMTWKQLEGCQQWKVTFGSHTVNHTRLTECGDDALMGELQTSLHSLQNRLERVIPALAYPGGYHDARVRQAVHNAGYACALGTSSRWGNGSESDLFQLRRQHITS